MRWISAFLLSTWIGVTHAELMSPVVVNGIEWLQPADFDNVSWMEIAAVCPGGVCGAGSVRGHSVEGWNWATQDDVIALFEVTTPYIHTDGTILEVPGDSQWATDFFDVLGFKPTDESTGDVDFRYIRAIVSTTLEPPSGNRAVRSLLYDGRMPSLPDQVAIRESQYDQQRFSGVGAWFYRETTQVPIPGVLPLLFIALAGLRLQRAL